MKSPDVHYTRFTFALLLLTSLFVFSSERIEAKKHVANGKIAFQSVRTGNSEIFVMNDNGTNPVNVSNNPASDASPSWSPDGKKIAFGSNRDGNTEIYLMDADGGNQTRLTFVSGTDGDPAWSPDGTKIVFQSQRDGNFEIYVMNADGSGQTRLTNSVASDLHGAWSPDSTKIIFDSLRDGDQEIYIMNANGTNQVRLTNNPGLDQGASFSPDGTKIAFQRHIGATANIMLMNPDGTNVVQLTSGDNNYAPSFSPDGKKIVFSSIRDGDYEVFTMNADGSAQTQLTTNTFDDTVTAWQGIPPVETIGVFRPATAEFLLRNSNTAGAPDITIPFGQSTDLPVVGDWTGNGKTDVGVFRNGQFLLRQPTTITVLGHPVSIIITLTVNFGQAGDLPVAGDWDGNGTDTPGVFRPSTGQWLLTNGPNTNNSSPPVDITLTFGQAGDTPLAGDWNNDSIDTVGLFRGSISTFILSNNFNGTIDIPTFLFGSLGSIGFTGDWNGEGTDTAGVFNKNLGVMGLNNTNTTGNGAGDIVFNFGQNGDIPVAGDWDGK